MPVFIFLTCVSLGIVSGVVYDLLYIARCAVSGIHEKAYTVKDKIFTAACDIIYFLILSAAFVFISVLFGFGEFRLYMPISCLLGVILYIKSFHIFVAFLVKRVYNKIADKKDAEKEGE